LEFTIQASDEFCMLLMSWHSVV